MKKITSYKILVFGVSLSVGLIVAAPSEVYALASVEFAIKELCAHMEGNLGGLLMITAGVGGMISAAFGNMKALYSCIITGIGAFTVSSMLSLYFDKAADLCSSGANGGGTTRTKIEQPLDTKVSNINEVSALKTFLNKGQNEASNDSTIESSSNVGDEELDSELF